MTGNDRIAFYSAVPGYYPATGSQSPVSLVAYRVNSASGTTAFNKLERLGKGLVWNGVSSTDTPVVFMPLTIAATWAYATSSTASDTAYELTALNSGLVADVSGGSTTQGAQVIQWATNGQTNQTWNLS